MGQPLHPILGAGGEKAASVDNRVDPPVGRPSKLDAAILCTQAKAALTGLGWKASIAHAAVSAAAADGANGTLEQLIRAALRRCPMPKA